MISSIVSMQCPFSNRCWAKLDLILPCLKPLNCSWKRTVNYHPVCPICFFIACGTRYLIDPAIVLFAFCAVMSCCKKFTYGIVCREPNFHIGNLECFRKGSSLFLNVSEFCPLYFLTVFFMFIFTM